MAAGGQAGDRDGTIRGNGHIIVAKAGEGHLAANGGTGHGDGAAFLRPEAVLSTLRAGVEQDVMLGIQRCGVGGQTIQGHIGLDAGAIGAYRHHEHTGKLRPNGGKLFAVSASLIMHHALIVGHGVIGHQHDGGAVCVGTHSGDGAVVLIGRDRHHIAFAAINADYLIMHVGQSDLGIHVAFNGLPVAEHIQRVLLAPRHALVALGVDIQVDITHIVHIAEALIDSILRKAAVADMQILRGKGDLRGFIPLAEIPIGHAVGILHAHKVVIVVHIAVSGRDGRKDECCGNVLLAIGHRLSFYELISPVIPEHTGTDGGALRGMDSQPVADHHCNLELRIRFRSCLCCSGKVLSVLFRVGCGGGFHGVAQYEDAAGHRLAIVIRLTYLSQTLTIGAGNRHSQGVIRIQRPIVGRNTEIIDALDLESVMLGIHIDRQAAVAVVLGVIALHPILAVRQRNGLILLCIAICHQSSIRQQILLALHTVGVGIELQRRDLPAVYAAKGHIRGHRQVRGVFVHRDRQDTHDDGSGVILFDLLCRHIGRQIIGARRLRRGEGHLAVLSHYGVFNIGQAAVGIDPGQLGAFQRFDLILFYQRGHGNTAVVGNAVAVHGDIHFGLRLHRQAAQGCAVALPQGVVIQCIAVLIQEEFHCIAGLYRRLREGVAGIALSAGGILVIHQHIIVGGLTVDGKTAVAGIFTKNCGDKARAANNQIVTGRLRGKVFAQHKLMGLDQHVQGGHAAVYLIGEAVLLRQVRSDLDSRCNAVQIAACHLRTDVDSGGGGRRGIRRIAARHLHMDDIIDGRDRRC